jgi:ubiquinone/menaquinone biosynthesis C-methylase UbiE
MTNSSTTLSPVEIFLKSWRVYQDIIKHNYMFHREISNAVSDALEAFKPNQKLSILDLGCGDASMILPMLTPSRVNHYVGCDLSQPALDIAHQALETKEIPHQLICDDMLQVATEQKDASFDLIFSSYALHHLNAHRKELIIEEISRILVPGGRFVLVDVFREPTEDRPQYMRSYMGKLQETWVRLTPEAKALVIEHATEFDFPEHTEFYRTICKRVGLCSGKQLAKHTWHEALVFEKLC